MGGEIGFDEGGVLQALNEEVYSKTVKEFRRNRKGEVIEETTHTVGVSMATVIAILTLYYGPEVLDWFRSKGAGTVVGAAEGLVDRLTGAANWAKDIVAPDDTTQATGPTPQAWEPGAPEYEAALHHTTLGRTGFKDLLARHPNAGAFAGCSPWRQANHNQRKLYRLKWGKPATWQWPGCTFGFS